MAAFFKGIKQILISVIGMIMHTCKLEFNEMFRRECIHAFRPVTFLLGYVEWYMPDVCVGNGFIRSGTSITIRGSLDGKGFPFSAFFHPTCIPQKRYRAERINPFPTKHPDKFQFDSQLIHADNLKTKNPPLLVTGGKVYQSSGDYTSSMTAISAASPRRSPVRVTLV